MRKSRVCAALVALLMVATVATGAAVAGEMTEQAEIVIETPSYADSGVTEDHNENRTLYEIGHGKATIAPINFDPEDVETFGIEESEGTITYNGDFNSYSFSSDGNTGTFRVYWVVDETVELEEQDGNETVTVEETRQVRYETVIRISEHQEYEHVTSGRLDEMRDDAQNWSAWESELDGLFGDDVNVELRTQQAQSYLSWIANPVTSLIGTPGSVLFMLLMTNEGRFILVTFGLLHLFARRFDIKYLYKRESTKPDELELDEKLSKMDKEERDRSLQNHDWQHIAEHDDRTARAFREATGENPHDGSRRLLESWLPYNQIRNRLLAMGYNDWVGTVEREDISTDGGSESRRIIDADVVPTDEVADDVETVDLTDDVSDEYIDALGMDHPDVMAFDYVGADLPADEDGVELEEMGHEELTAKLAEQNSGIEETQWIELLLESVAHVRNHEYTDKNGKPRTVHLILNEWLRHSQLMSDRYRWPAFEYPREALERAIADEDVIEDAEEILDRIEDDGEDAEL